MSSLREELGSSKEKVMRLESELEAANETKHSLEEALDALRSEMDDRLRASEDALRECEGRVSRGQAAWMEERVGLDERMDHPPRDSHLVLSTSHLIFNHNNHTLPEARFCL